MIKMKKEGRFFMYPTHFWHSDEPLKHPPVAAQLNITVKILNIGTYMSEQTV